MNKTKRSYVNISLRLIKMVKPLSIFMVLAILFGALGHLMAIFIPSFSTLILSKLFENNMLKEIFNINAWEFNFKRIFMALVLAGIFRGLFRYIEQLLNHYIAFKILAIIRDKVFKKMRKLAPAKLEGENRGKLISMITNDIELLEVFYAHTVSPFFIFLVVAIVVNYFLYIVNPLFVINSICTYFLLIFVVPLIINKMGNKYGKGQRESIGTLNTVILESFKGIKECIGFNFGKERLEKMKGETEKLEKINDKLAFIYGINGAISNLFLMASYILNFYIGGRLYFLDKIDISGFLFATVLYISSFGPTLALSSLINNLLLTFASGDRILDILDEEPLVKDIENENSVDEFESIEMNNVSFKYDFDNLENKTFKETNNLNSENYVLKDFNLKVNKGEIVGIKGKSGLGKSTVLKLLLRFYDVNSGEILMNNINIKNINTSSLKKNQSYVSQTVYLFKDSILNNIKIAKLDATREEVIEACKNASIHDFIVTLKDGYDTIVDNNFLSQGEKQRIGVARAFLHSGNLILLDEFTSNIDSLNEGIILKALYEKKKDHTIVIVSHRESTMKICERVIEMESLRSS